MEKYIKMFFADCFRKGIFYFMRKNKILTRICIGVLAATIVSSLAVATLFAKYISTGSGKSHVVYPYAFGVELTGLDMDKISVNFSRDGAHATPLGYFTETISIPFTVKAASYNEIATDVSIRLIFNSEFSTMIKRASTNRYDQGVTCDFSVVDESGNALSGMVTEENGCLIWESNETKLEIAGELKFFLEIDVHNTSLSVGYTANEEYNYISDAITVDVVATQSR